MVKSKEKVDGQVATASTCSFEKTLWERIASRDI